MLVKLDRMINYQDSKTFKFIVNDHKRIDIDTDPYGDIEEIWLFDYSRPIDDHIVAWGTYDTTKTLTNIVEVMSEYTEVLDTDLLLRIADNIRLVC